MAYEQCAYCGEMFSQVKSNQLCCSRTCLAKRTGILQRWTRKYKAKHRKPRIRANAKPQKAKKIMSITEIQRIAQSKGMSYGMYIARVEGGMRG